MHTTPRNWLIVVLAICLCGVACPALADNPGYDRPGYGFTPVVLGAGNITLEQGLPDWSRSRQGGITSAQYSADSLLRIGLGGPLELQLASSPWNSLRESPGNSTQHGHGDTQLGLKLALPSANAAFSWGLLGSVELTDGAAAFRSDRRQYLLGGQFNWQVNQRNSIGLYLQNVRSAGMNSPLVAINDSYSLSSTLSLYAEAVGLHNAHQHAGMIAGSGLAWMVTPRVQLDAGVDHRVSGTASQWQTNLGVSIYFGH